jgi:hypothetical protein
MAEEHVQQTTIGTQTETVSSELALKWQADLVRQVRRAIRQTVPLAIEESLEHLGYDQEVAGLVQLLAARSNDAKDEVLRKALTLYGLALDAREKGNKVVIVNSDDYIIHDVIGFDSMVEALGPRKD